MGHSVASLGFAKKREEFSEKNGGIHQQNLGSYEKETSRMMFEGSRGGNA